MKNGRPKRRPSATGFLRPDGANHDDIHKLQEQALQANTAFREQRTRKECGVIDDRKLHEQCVASFH
jgi:hypothetical protein